MNNKLPFLEKKIVSCLFKLLLKPEVWVDPKFKLLVFRTIRAHATFFFFRFLMRIRFLKVKNSCTSYYSLKFGTFVRRGCFAVFLISLYTEMLSILLKRARGATQIYFPLLPLKIAIFLFFGGKNDLIFCHNWKSRYLLTIFSTNKQPIVCTRHF